MGDAVVRAGANGAEGKGDPLSARDSAADPQGGVATSGAGRRRVGDEVAQEGVTVARAEEKLKLGKGGGVAGGDLMARGEPQKAQEGDWRRAYSERRFGVLLVILVVLLAGPPVLLGF